MRNLTDGERDVLRELEADGREELPALADDEAEGGPVATLDEIDFDRAERAYAGISFSAETRAARVQREYVEDVESLHQELAPLATTPELRDLLAAEVARYKEGYRRHLYAMLDAQSRVISPMIAGPANFPVARNQKRIATEDRRRDEFLSWRERARAAVRAHFVPPTTISSADPDAAERLAAKLAEQRADHERMVASNKAWRLKDRGAALAALRALGYADGEANRIAADKQAPFASYQLTNSTARIKATEGRLAEVARIRETAAAFAPIVFDATDVRPAGQIDIDDGRVVITFAERTSRELYEALRARAFLWSPKRGAFVRKHTPEALAAARLVVGAA